MSSKNTLNANNKVFYAVVAPYQGNGEDKLILHEAKIDQNGSIMYGVGNTLIIDPSAVLRIDELHASIPVGDR